MNKRQDNIHSWDNGKTKNVENFRSDCLKAHTLFVFVFFRLSTYDTGHYKYLIKQEIEINKEMKEQEWQNVDISDNFKGCLANTTDHL